MPAHPQEEKQLESSVDAIISRVADLKNSLAAFILKLENEFDRMNWPSVLDNFALVSGQLNTLNKLLRNDKTPILRNQVIIPLLLSPDRDDELMKLTEGRVPVFSHEVVPDHLRTKPDPEVEEQEKQLSAEAARLAPDVAQKYVQSMNKMCSNLLDKLNNTREERESESGALRQNKQTFNPADTNALVAAIGFGKGLSKLIRQPQGGPVPSGQSVPGGGLQGGPSLSQVTIQGGPSQQGLPGQVPSQQGQPGKMPSTIKTNIKSASMHPYQR
ncbi:mediator of RNA polymerase II transcription subunit 8 isoform X3 [Leucoraja erinacea]|uniref:mediator of RNA polymerase II transcription subunit 8 isoform X3 n=1 Tax=Leucoraja erinaceus TaxID=7782 RepID=UPI002454E11A|nr:mediator of RNA polymerase II transcription subunit 8 isoform X3 [Leucoraja erinacea]